MTIDILSVLVASGVLAFAYVLMSLVTWLSAAGQIKGPGEWLAGFALIGLGIALVAMRGRIPDLASIWLANSLISLGILFKAYGFMSFLGVRGPRLRFALAAPAALVSIMLYVFLSPFPSLPARMASTSAANVVYGLAIASIIWAKAPGALAPQARGTAAFFGAFAALYAFRFARASRWSGGREWISSGDPVEPFILLGVVAILAAIAVMEMQLMHARLRGDLRAAGDEMRRANEALSEEVRRRSAAEGQLIALNRELSSTQKEIMITLSEVVEFRSKETARHVARVGEYARALCKARGLPAETVQIIADAAPMHDIGKISVSDDILNKPAGLSEPEIAVMREHTLVGHGLLNKSDRPLIKMAALIALEHHEYWDGSGYPYGKSGEDISPAGRVVCLCDVFDALSSYRPYKDAWELPRILEYLRLERGRMFEPALVDALFEHLDEFLAIAKALKDDD